MPLSKINKNNKLVFLEQPFWELLEMVAKDFGKNVHQLITDIERALPKDGAASEDDVLSQRIRVGCLRWLAIQKRKSQAANENNKS
ncbi:MAG: ribbon-helix-helix domain-containing protein [Rhodospirillaceae bacterium]|nr:ribbon-helix-helix domain-containing protein [Rhodospirillaceae bacterium]